MTTSRPYDTKLRHQKQAELKARIAAATASLHAAKGATATSYAEIAAEAGVSVPTVYAHYPTQRELLMGCTGHVAANAPPFPADAILAAADLATAADLLVDAVERQHVHFEPWGVWREDRVIPFLAELSAARRHDSTRLIAQILKRHLGPGDHREAVAGWETALSFDSWHRLARSHRLSRPAVRRLMLRALLAIASPQANPHTDPDIRSK